MEGVDVQLYTFLTLVIEGGKWTSHPGQVSDQERTPVPNALEAGWISEQCGSFGEEKTLVPAI